MNETLQVIKSRRSVRKYLPEQIDNADLAAILESGRYAPSASNQQKWHFSVIQNKALLDRMVGIIRENIVNSGNEYLRERASKPGYSTFHHAPTVVIVSADENSRFAPLDCGAAIQNMALAAESLDIASCIIASTRFLFDSEAGNALRRELGIPDGYAHVCSIALGRREGERPTAPPRNPNVVNYVR